VFMEVARSERRWALASAATDAARACRLLDRPVVDQAEMTKSGKMRQRHG